MKLVIEKEVVRDMVERDSVATTLSGLIKKELRRLDKEGSLNLDSSCSVVISLTQP